MPIKWSHAAKAWLKNGTLKLTAEALVPPVSQAAIRHWRDGVGKTPHARVPQLIQMALAENITLTPADFGRPGLATDSPRKRK